MTTAAFSRRDTHCGQFGRRYEMNLFLWHPFDDM
jgi:hypothetical protein